MAILDKPPAGWKRPPIPSKVKLQVLLNQEGRSAICKERLGLIEDVHFDHRPALWERKFDTETGDTIPPANDPTFIEAITIEQHDVRTHGPGGTSRITTRGSDSGNRAKDRAVIKKQAAHHDAMKNKGKRKEKPKSKLRSKSSFPTGRKFPKRPPKDAKRPPQQRRNARDQNTAAGTDIRNRERPQAQLRRSQGPVECGAAETDRTFPGAGATNEG